MPNNSLLKKEILSLMENKLENSKKNKAINFYKKAYRWQKEYWRAGKNCKQRLIQAGNQVGKTETTCYEIAYHATGIYPADWQGYVFDKKNLEIYCMASTIDKAKTLLQKRLIGEWNPHNNQMDGGYIYKKNIYHDTKIFGQSGKNVKSIKIKHINKSFTKITFASYEQGQVVLMGEILDCILIDEEPQNANIYGQAVARTINGDNKRGGLLLLSFTPEWGYTELVAKFAEDLKEAQYFNNICWADAPHLTEKIKKQMRGAIPIHELPAREFGLAQMGSGVIYTTAEENLYMDDNTKILDYFKKICAIDFGNKVTTVVWGAWDIDRDILYIYDLIYCENLSIAEIANQIISRGEWIPLAYPHDGHIEQQAVLGLGKSLIKKYQDLGIKILSTNIKDEAGTISVEAGIKRLDEREKAGKLKVNRNLSVWFKERRQYHRVGGKIFKKNDHTQDATRYLEMGLRFAICKPTKNIYKEEINVKLSNIVAEAL